MPHHYSRRQAMKLLATLPLIAACGGAPAPVSSPTPVAVATIAPTVAPTGSPATATSASPISVPDGFHASIWSEEPGVTAITFDDGGRMFVATSFGNVLILEDRDEDGHAERVSAYASGLDRPLGLAFAGADLFVSQRTKVSRLRDTNGVGVVDSVEDILTNLPVGDPAEGGEVHQTNGVARGPDGLIYVSQGATGNARIETEPWAGTIFTIDPATGKAEVFVEGLRNPYALIFDAQGRLFATDNGADGLALAEDPPDELNLIKRGQHYGHPYYIIPPPPGLTLTPPIAEFGPHTSANGLDVWEGSDIFVSLFVPREVVRVSVAWDGDQVTGTTIRPFAAGFVSPLAVRASPDGRSLFVSDFLSGPVYRITTAAVHAEETRQRQARAPVIRALVPATTVAGQRFNVQPDGQSALTVECENATTDTIVLFGGTPLTTTVGSPMLVTALVPAALFARPGRHPVRLRNRLGDSAPVDFTVTG